MTDCTRFIIIAGVYVVLLLLCMFVRWRRGEWGEGSPPVVMCVCNDCAHYNENCLYNCGKHFITDQSSPLYLQPVSEYYRWQENILDSVLWCRKYRENKSKTCGGE